MPPPDLPPLDPMRLSNVASFEGEEFRARMVREHCRSNEDAVVLGAELLRQACKVFRAVGGQNLVDLQLLGALRHPPEEEK